MSEEQNTESTEEAAGTEADVKETLYPSEDASDEKTEDTGEEGDTAADEDKSDDSAEEPEDEAEDAESADAVTAEDLEFPQGIVSEERVSEFVDLVNGFKDLKPKELAQKLVDFQSQIYADQYEQHQQKVAEWEKQTKSGSLGGDKLQENLAIAAKARDMFKESHPEMTESFIEVLNQTGVGNHPAVIEFFYNIGNAVSEDSFVKGSSSTGQKEKSIKDILYPSS